MRLASPKKTHAAKDLCTIEQAEYIALIALKNHFGQMYALECQAEALLAMRNRWYRRLWRALTSPRTGQ